MSFTNRLTAAQIAALLGDTGDIDGGDPTSTFDNNDGGTPSTVAFDAIIDGGGP
jgi:hypothetical protein